MRNNVDRMGLSADPDNNANLQSEVTPPTTQAMQFIVPTELVDLPTKGLFYDEGHPLHNATTVEIKHMTTKEEDILTNQSYIKNGTVLDRLLQSVIVDKSIKVKDLYIGDKNAILVASRVFGYGPDYKANVTCPACKHNGNHTFDLQDLEHTSFEENLEKYNGTSDYEKKSLFLTVPRTKANLELRLLKSDPGLNTKKTNTIVDLYKKIIKSVNGVSDPEYINGYINSMAAVDSRYLRSIYSKIVPNIDFSTEYECDECGTVSNLEVPLNAEFFWPDAEVY
jgi:hypothetical protein